MRFCLILADVFFFESEFFVTFSISLLFEVPACRIFYRSFFLQLERHGIQLKAKIIGFKDDVIQPYFINFQGIISHM